jgi:hypothetical protein
MLLSNKVGQARDQVARDNSANVTDRLASLFGGDYAGRRSNQMSAADATVQQGDLAFENALQIMQAFGGMGNSSSQSKPSLLGTLL